MNENCIVSLCVGFNFKKGLDRIEQCIEAFNINADFIGFSEYPEWCVKHTDIPYAFKFYLLKHCFSLGYKNVLYIDSSIYPKNDLNNIWELLNNQGYYLAQNDHSIGVACHDKLLQKFNISREDSMRIRCLQGGFIGLNKTFIKSIEWLDTMIELSKDGVSFIGSYSNKTGLCSKDNRVVGHFHDQVVATIISIKIGFLNWSLCHTNFIVDRDYVRDIKEYYKNQHWWEKVDMSL